MNASFRLPLFPLYNVLFPGQPLLMRAFEPRYLDLVRRCLEEEQEFGIALIRDGPEVGGPATPFSVGTTARIIRHQEITDGQILLVVMGQHRFQIVNLLDHRPYPQAEVIPWPWIRQPPPTPTLMDQVGEWLRRYVGALSDSVPAILASENLPHDAVELGVLAALVLQVPVDEKQALLEIPDAATLLAQVGTLLRRQTRIAEGINALQPVDPLAFECFSWN